MSMPSSGFLPTCASDDRRAGPYGTQPAMAAQLGNRKIDNAERTKADVVVTANPGCHLQLAGGLNQRGSQMKVLHIAEVLDMAYGGAV